MSKFAMTAALSAASLMFSGCGGNGSKDGGPEAKAPECSYSVISDFNSLAENVRAIQGEVNNDKLRRLQRSCGTFRASIGVSSCRVDTSSGTVNLSYAGNVETLCTQVDEALFQSNDVNPPSSNHSVPYEIFYGIELRVRDAETLNRAIMTGTSEPAYFQAGRLFDTETVNPRQAACALAFEDGAALSAGQSLRLTRVKLLDQGVRFVTDDERAGIICVQRAAKQWTLADLRVMFGGAADFSALR